MLLKFKNSFLNFRQTRLRVLFRKMSTCFGLKGRHYKYSTNKVQCSTNQVGRVAQPVQRLATGWTVRASNPGGGARFSAPVQTGPGAHPASCTIGTGSFPGVKSGMRVTLTPHPLLVPWSRKGRAIPLPPIWAVRPVQSLSTRVHFTFYQYKSSSWYGIAHDLTKFT